MRSLNNEECEQFFQVVEHIFAEHIFDRPWLRVKYGICCVFNIRVRCSITCSLFAHFEFSVRVRSCSIIYDFSEFMFVRVQ